MTNLKTFFIIPIMTLIFFTACELSDPNDPFIVGKTNGGDDDDNLSPQELIEQMNYIFDTNTVAKITISISSNEWNKQLIYFDTNSAHEEFVHADFIFEKDGTVDVVSNVGFRIRGNLSRSRPEGNLHGGLHDPVNPQWNHSHFKIDFNRYEPGQRFRGMRGMILKWHNSDPTYCREVYCYDLMRRFGVYTTPKAWYVQLEIDIKEDNDPADYEVYIMIENFDETFLKTIFTNETETSQGWEGNLWKCLWGATLATGSTWEIGIEDINLYNESESFRPWFDLKKYNDDVYSNRYLAFTNEAKDQLEGFIYDLDSRSGSALKTYLDANFDMELFLRAMAVEVAVSKWDSYWGLNGNNWFLYFHPDGRAYYITYDLDNTLGITYSTPASELSVINFKEQDHDTLPLTDKALTIPEYFTMYTNFLYQLLDPNNDYFFIGASTNRIKRWHDLIAPYVDNDIGEFTSIVDTSDTWSPTDYYYFFSGDDSGNGSSAPGCNFFLSRTRSISDELGFNYDTSGDGGGETTNTNGGVITNGYVSPEFTTDTVFSDTFIPAETPFCYADHSTVGMEILRIWN